MKANLLWPAMWNSNFWDDDPLNSRLADEYGIVMGTSHHEPMLRSWKEWPKYGRGPWDYLQNGSLLKEYWRDGIRRMGTYESIITLGMRGDGDKPMNEETDIKLLERIIDDQRKILAETTGIDVTTIPQVWALYKEVEDYYDKGMRVPDDVTILFSDDNWGNIRRLPKPTDVRRKGGYGIYYHFDYVGGPRSYKWLNTNQIERVWEQLRLAYEHGVKRLWIVNVGDIKPMEFPISFFLDYAWDPQEWTADRLPEYYRDWASQQLSDEHAEEIAQILAAYSKYNARRKPELLSPETYSLTAYDEAATIVSNYNRLAAQAERIYNSLPQEYRDAYFQLVLHPVLACANLNAMYFTIAKNRLYAEQERAATNDLARKARELFAHDAKISRIYNQVIAAGKWNHTMDQTHIGYKSWQQPEANIMPELRSYTPRPYPEMRVAIEGSAQSWPNSTSEAILPTFDVYNQQEHYIEIFNRGDSPFDYTTDSPVRWLQTAPASGRIDKEIRVWVRVDWDGAPSGFNRIPITIRGSERTIVTVYAIVNKPPAPDRESLEGYIDGCGYISIEAPHYTRAIPTNGIRWEVIPNLGRTLAAITAVPPTAPAQIPGGSAPHLEYKVYFPRQGEFKIWLYFSPTLDFYNTGGLRYAISLDDEHPQIPAINADRSPKAWEKWVADNIIISNSSLRVEHPGAHMLKYWFVDPGAVLQKIVIDTGGLRPSYLGLPETYHRGRGGSN